MSTAIAITPSSGIKAAKTVCRVNVTGADLNDASSYDAALYPSEPAIKYYLMFDAPAGVDDKKSQIFSPSPDGKFEFNSFIFDAAGTWTVRLKNASSNADVATLSVTVS